ncbi:pilin N-terminal domain-containing protein [Lacticaseibacillus manihotivorans]|uniref:pilin N-terminal domain-containing protein n=1 Tax=Lacticaseibacillus manihotivorans TaxID=88233 RepID=UPI000B2D9538|nr:pilin N-terminal domain-containing protein [Lacticaseibacillus manihotivorans]
MKTATVNGEDGVASLNVPTYSGDHYAAYLLIETSVDADTLVNVDLTKKAAPMYLRLGHTSQTTLNPVHLYPKNVATSAIPSSSNGASNSTAPPNA